MALRTYVRKSDGQKVTLDDDFLTQSTLDQLSDIPSIEIPKAIQSKKDESNKQKHK